MLTSICKCKPGNISCRYGRVISVICQHVLKLNVFFSLLLTIITSWLWIFFFQKQDTHFFHSQIQLQISNLIITLSPDCQWFNGDTDKWNKYTPHFFSVIVSQSVAYQYYLVEIKGSLKDINSKLFPHEPREMSENKETSVYQAKTGL